VSRSLPADYEARLAYLSTLSLAKGAHAGLAEGLCTMEAAAYLAGEPHSDHPACACPVIAAFLRTWNDGLPDDAHRDLLLKRFVPKVVGSRSTAGVERRRSLLALDWLIRTYTPAWLDLVESLKPHAASLRALPEIVDMDTASAAAPVVRAARDAAGSAARDAAWAAARAAAGSAARDAATDAAWDAARAAATDAAWDAARDAATDAAWDAARDAAGAAAWDAARAALLPTVMLLQESAVQLVDRMLAAEVAS
jgi:hypothetical protein